MELGDFESEEQDLLQTFFRPSDPDANLISLERILSPSRAGYSLIRECMSPLLESPFQSTFLPRVVEDDDTGEKKTYIYGIARSEDNLKQLTEEARSFIGPSHSTFRGSQASLYPDQDQIEREVYDYTGDRALRFRVSNDTLRTLLRRWRSIRERQESGAPESIRSKKLVLRDFHTALRAQRKDDCLALLQEIQERNLLDALNRRFLRVQYFHNFEEWKNMLNMDLEDILSVRRPPRVTEALIEALYYTEVDHLVEAEKVEEARSVFWSQIHPQYSSLFDTQGRIDSTPASRLFMLRACPPSEPRLDQAKRILQKAPEDDDFLHAAAEAFLGDLKSDSGKSPTDQQDQETTSPSERAHSAFEKSDFDTAAWWARRMTRGVEKAQILLHCAYNLETTSSESSAIEAVDALDPEGRNEVLGDEILRLIYSQISGSDPDPQERQVTAVPDDWLSWFRRLENSQEWDQGRALNLAKRGEEEWSVKSLASDVTSLYELNGLIDDLTDSDAGEKRKETFQRALVHFLGACLDDPAFPRESLATLYDRLIFALSELPGVRKSHLDLFMEFAQARFRIGVDEDEYQMIVEVAADLWEANASVHRANWGLDVLDMLAIYPKRKESPVVHLLSSVARLFQERRPRLEAEQVWFIRRLCEELGHEEIREPIPEPQTEVDGEASDPIKRMEGNLVGVYTLDERVGRRVRNLISEIADVEVRLNHDMQATDELQAVAQNSDLMVIVTGCAKHAATNYIKDVRGDRPVIYPDGTGSSSIMRAIREEAASRK